MPKLLLALALTLAACAPAVQLAQPGETATLTRDGQSLLLTNPGPDALTGDPARPGDGPALTLDGTAALVLDEQGRTWCVMTRRETGVRWSCTLPEVAAGSRVRVAWVAGDVQDAGALAYRPSRGAVPVLVWLR